MKKCRWCRIVFQEGETAAGERLQCSDCSLPFVVIKAHGAADYTMIRPGMEWPTLVPAEPIPLGTPLTKEELA